MLTNSDPADHYSDQVQRVYEAADVSRNPMSGDCIFELAAERGVGPDSLVLDIGCANGGNSRKLLAHTGCRIEGVDYLNSLVAMGRRENREAGVEDRFRIQQGSMLDIPFPDDHFDFVFCRDALGEADDLPKAIAECRRVLRPGRFMLVYVTQATESLSADELSEFGDNMDATYMEACLRQEFTVTQKIALGSQGVQHRVESGDDEATRNLLKIARLMTWREDYVAEHGERTYEIALADLKWQVYMLLGKLAAHTYVLRKAVG